MRDKKATLNGICRSCFPQNWPRHRKLLLTQIIRAHRVSGRNPWSLPKQTAVYLDADIITRRSDVVQRWSSQTMLDGIHAHHQDMHENIWPEGFAIFFLGIAFFQSTDEPCRQKTHGAGPITTPDQCTKCRSLYFLSRSRLFRTAYEQASRDDSFKIANPRIDSPLSWLTLKSRLRKALNLPRSGGIAPAHTTDALNKNIRLDLKINQSNSNIHVAG